MSVNTYKIILEFDGTDFSGWQFQPRRRTVQGEVEKALHSLFQEEIRVTAAGRTDAGVHALGQVINFSTVNNRTLDEIRLGLNSLLPDDVTVGQVARMPDDFNARFDALQRHYEYRIFRGNSATHRRFAWCLWESLNVHDMQRCAELIIGEHDFQSFCSSSAEVDHFLCGVEVAKWFYQTPKLLVFSISANRFLHNMVRILTGTMVEVGRGRFSIADFANMIDKKDRTVAGITAPACGLFLMKVDY